MWTCKEISRPNDLFSRRVLADNLRNPNRSMRGSSFGFWAKVEWKRDEATCILTSAKLSCTSLQSARKRTACARMRDSREVRNDSAQIAVACFGGAFRLA